MEMSLNEFTARVLDAAAKAGIAPAAVAYSASESFSARVRQGELEAYEVSDALGLQLRGRVGARIGSASTQALDEESIALLINGVKDSADLIETDEQDDILPPDDRYSDVCNYDPALETVSAEAKITLAREIDQRIAKGDPRITPSRTVVASASENISLSNTLGLSLSHRSNMIYAYASALAKEGKRTATGSAICCGHSLDALDAKEIAEKCMADALSKLHAERMKSGSLPVVIRADAMGDLLATFSGIFSADNAQKGLSLLAGREGENIAAPCVNLIDDPLRAWGLASCPFDNEGAAARTKSVIENGVLKTLLHNRKTAKKAGGKTTGNAAGGGRVAPSNFYITPGTMTQEELLRRMGDGLFLTEVSGLHAGANAVSGDFSLLARGFEVRGGQCVRAVEQFTVAGNFYRLLCDIECIGSDLKFDASPIGAPSVFVRSLSIAGED